MFSLIQKVFHAARTFDAVLDKIQKIEVRLDTIDKKIEALEKLSDENDSLWQYIDEQKEMEAMFAGSAAEFEKEISDIMAKSLKTQGDA